MRSSALPAAVLGLLACWGLALGAGEDPSQVLWDAAQAAQARGDEVAVTRLMRAWATSQPERAAPAPLASAAEEARAFAARAGRLRVYASLVSPARLRVGLEDPAGVVERVDVFAVAESGGRARLTREDAEAAGRLEYRVPPGVREVVVVAVMDARGQPVVLAQVTSAVGAAPPLPAAPAPKVDGAPPAPVAVPEATVAPVAWWWVAAGVVAAALVGGAVWQETR